MFVGLRHSWKIMDDLCVQPESGSEAYKVCVHLLLKAALDPTILPTLMTTTDFVNLSLAPTTPPTYTRNQPKRCGRSFVIDSPQSRSGKRPCNGGNNPFFFVRGGYSELLRVQSAVHALQDC